MLWTEIERDFAIALHNPNIAEPTAIAATPSRPARKRFNVYRNNVAVSLSEALAAGYPVVKQLVGDEFFSAIARAYVSNHLPKSPVMLHYGADFASFIEAFEPAAALPFLADVARIEHAAHQAYHAEDCEPISIELLQAIPPEQLEAVQFHLHPSLHLVASEWPAISIWHIHQIHDDPAAAMQRLSLSAEAALIVRPHWEVDLRLISDATFKFIGALQSGVPLGAAAEPLVGSQAAEMGLMLQLLFATGCVIGLSPHSIPG